MERTARALGRAARILHAGADKELDAAFAKLSELRVGGIVVTGSPFFNNRRDRLLALSARFGGPVISQSEFAPPGNAEAVAGLAAIIILLITFGSVLGATCEFAKLLQRTP